MDINPYEFQDNYLYEFAHHCLSSKIGKNHNEYFPIIINPLNKIQNAYYLFLLGRIAPLLTFLPRANWNYWITGYGDWRPLSRNLKIDLFFCVRIGSDLRKSGKKEFTMQGVVVRLRLRSSGWLIGWIRKKRTFWWLRFRFEILFRFLSGFYFYKRIKYF